MMDWLESRKLWAVLFTLNMLTAIAQIVDGSPGWQRASSALLTAYCAFMYERGR